jgi:hypothetical protein
VSAAQHGLGLVAIARDDNVVTTKLYHIAEHRRPLRVGIRDQNVRNPLCWPEVIGRRRRQGRWRHSGSKGGWGSRR